MALLLAAPRKRKALKSNDFTLQTMLETITMMFAVIYLERRGLQLAT